MDYLLGILLILCGLISSGLIISTFHYGYKKDQERNQKSNFN